jgi:hypothetical protein
MTDELRTLLAGVAEGRVTPEEATRRLELMDQGVPPAQAAETATETGTDSAGPGPAGQTATGDASRATAPGDAAQPGGQPSAGPTSSRDASPVPGPSDGPVERVRVVASARPVRVVADPTVDTLTVEGPHNVRREGSSVRVEAPVGADPQASGDYRYERRTGLSRWISQASSVGVPMTVRMNPDLELEVDVMAGSLDVTGLRGPLSFTVTAGSLRAVDCAGPLRGTVRAGSAKLDLRPVAGASSIRVESGSVTLQLQHGSDVRVRARAELGEVKVLDHHGTSAKVVQGDGSYEVVVGSGTASIDLEAVMGSLKVTTP